MNATLGFDRSEVPTILGIARCQIAVTELMLIDSLDMTESTRQILVNACTSASESVLIVVHGTDTMVKSATAIAAAALEKTVVLTGAIVPNRVEHSDASFNLGYAICAAQLADVGVWIAMNAQLHPWQAVRKNHKLGIFEKT